MEALPCPLGHSGALLPPTLPPFRGGRGKAPYWAFAPVEAGAVTAFVDRAALEGAGRGDGDRDRGQAARVIAVVNGRGRRAGADIAPPSRDRKPWGRARAAETAPLFLARGPKTYPLAGTEHGRAAGRER